MVVYDYAPFLVKEECHDSSLILVFVFVSIIIVFNWCTSYRYYGSLKFKKTCFYFWRFFINLVID